MHPQPPTTTVLDVLDTFFGSTWGSNSISTINDQDLFDLVESIDDYYSKAKASLPTPDSVRQYSGGASFMQPKDPHAGLQRLPTSPSGGIIPFKASAALYADEIAINCPLDSWICRNRGAFRTPGSYRGRNGMTITLEQPEQINRGGFWSATMDESRQAIATALGTLADFEVAIRSGWLVLVPHLRAWKQAENEIWTQVRRDSMDLDFYDIATGDWQDPLTISDFVAGMIPVPAGGYLPQDNTRAHTEGPSLYFNASLAIANYSHSRYLATRDSDMAMLRHKVAVAGKLNSAIRDSLAIHAIDHVLAPVLTSENVEDLIAIRQNEGVFAEWRTGLQELVKGSIIPAATDPDEAHDYVVDKVQTLIAHIDRDAKKSQSLRTRLTRSKMELIDVGVAAVVWAVPGDIATKLITSTAALLKVALQSICSPTHEPSSVLLQLRQARITR